jgi:hypothetical protein
MRDYLISRNAVIDELTLRIGVCDIALVELNKQAEDYFSRGFYGGLAKVAADAIGCAYKRSMCTDMLRVVKSMPVKGICERGDSDAQH